LAQGADQRGWSVGFTRKTGGFLVAAHDRPIAL